MASVGAILIGVVKALVYIRNYTHICEISHNLVKLYDLNFYAMQGLVCFITHFTK